MLREYICPICKEDLGFADDHIDLGISTDRRFALECGRGHRFLAKEEVQTGGLELRRSPFLDQTISIEASLK